MYVMDWACRSFSYATLRTMIEVVLENMPAGERACDALHSPVTAILRTSCRSATIRTILRLTEVVLENMPAGGRPQWILSHDIFMKFQRASGRLPNACACLASGS